ncbi:MAG: nucleoside-triphosphatase [Thermoleophilia bacterium]
MSTYDRSHRFVGTRGCGQNISRPPIIPTVYILTGERTSGKSTVCARVADLARELGYRVAGLLTLRIESGPQSTHRHTARRREVVDLATGRTFPFGHRRQTDATDERAQTISPAGLPASGGPLAGWELDDDVFTQGNEILAASTPCDLLIIDELGPLELLHGQGWMDAFPAIDSRRYTMALVVCRPLLVDQCLSRLEEHTPIIIETTHESRDGLPASLVEGL